MENSLSLHFQHVIYIQTETQHSNLDTRLTQETAFPTPVQFCIVVISPSAPIALEVA